MAYFKIGYGLASWGWEERERFGGINGLGGVKIIC